ncbi:MAG: zinc ribbon domain-containing protein [Thermodesulfobacteriota bacterium]
MPIYEFRCLKCNDLVEFLLVNTDEKIEMKCPKCESRELERVMSTTNFAAGNPTAGEKAGSQTRTCGSGTCTTYNVPGYSR